MILMELKMKSKQDYKQEIEALTYAISTIAEIIHMQMPLRYQDRWLESIVDAGIWKPEELE
tara:strand:- start:729 stop:911 length:183 start_codon:yes stop_codon:yes gene_type:complete